MNWTRFIVELPPLHSQFLVSDKYGEVYVGRWCDNTRYDIEIVTGQGIYTDPVTKYTKSKEWYYWMEITPPELP